MKGRWLWWMVGGLLVLTGCATVNPVDPKDETRSLVFGYFDMKDAPSSLDWVTLKQYDKKGKDSVFYNLSAKDGLFFHVGIEPGSYQVARFGGVGGIPLLTERHFEYDYGSKGRNETAVRVQQPEIYFLGAFKYVDHSGGMFQADKFELKRSSQPTEREILQRLVKALETDKELRPYTRQLALAKRRLADL